MDGSNDDDDYGEVNDINWYDQLIEKNNISLHDQKKRASKKKFTGVESDALDEYYRMEEQKKQFAELKKQKQKVQHAEKPVDKILKNKKMIKNPSLMRLEERLQTINAHRDE